MLQVVMFKKRNIVIIFFIFIFFLCILGIFSLNKRNVVFNDSNKAQKKEDLFALRGTIFFNSSNLIKIHVDDGDDLEKDNEWDTELILSRDTEVISIDKNKQKSEPEYEKEILEYKTRRDGNISEFTSSDSMPGWFREEFVVPTDLNVGDSVYVYCLGGSDKKRCKAKRIVKNIEKKRTGLNETQRMSMRGEIVSLNEKLMVLKQVQIGDLDTATATLERIVIDDNTKIFLKKIKGENEFNEEQKKYSKDLEFTQKNGGDIGELSAPQWNILSDGSYLDLKIGEQIEIDLIKSDDKLFAEKIFLR